jgi:recA bacterial DNA recombination protein
VDVSEPLAPLFAGRGLRRGSTVAVSTAGMMGSGGTTLALALTVAASQAGSWCAVVGMPSVGAVMAAGLGVALERLAMVPDPGDQWATVAAALVDAVDIVLVQVPRRFRAADGRRLAARARERGTILVPVGQGWVEGADVRLSVAAAAWHGLGDGYGHLQARSVEVEATGRGAVNRGRRVQLWLPGPAGTVAVYDRAEQSMDRLAEDDLTADRLDQVPTGRPTQLPLAAPGGAMAAAG